MFTLWCEKIGELTASGKLPLWPVAWIEPKTAKARAETKNCKKKLKFEKCLKRTGFLKTYFCHFLLLRILQKSLNVVMCLFDKTFPVLYCFHKTIKCYKFIFLLNHCSDSFPPGTLKTVNK